MKWLMAYFWQIEFARNLSRQSGFRIPRQMLCDEMKKLSHGKMPGSDRAQQFNLTLAQSLHAAVSLLECEAAMPRKNAVDAAGAAFGKSGSWLAKGAIRIWLRFERDPFAGVVKRGPSLVAKSMWGNGMKVEDRRAPNEVSLCVLSCPFHDYFWSVGRSDLTPVLCAWDMGWHAELNASAKPIRINVRSTIAKGGDICEFAFHRPAHVGAK